MSTGNSNNVSPSASPGVGSSNAPKYGTLVPNRVFVGGISPHTTEAELHQLFSSYGSVKATKIIQDRAGVSKGYGFVTFETEDEARRLQSEGDNIIFKDRKLNIAPAIKKQPFSRMFDPSTASPTGTVLFHNGMPYTYQNGMAVFPAQEYGPGGYPAAQAQYPVMYPHQPVILPQHNFQYSPNQPQWGQSNSHWRWTAPIGYAPQPASGHQYVYAPASGSGGLQVLALPPQPVAAPAAELYLSPPPAYQQHEAQAAAAALAEHDYQQEMQRAARYASPCKPSLGRGGFLCGPRGAAMAGRCGPLKQPDLGGAGDAPPPRAETGPMTPPPTPGRGDQPAKVETAAARLQTMSL